MSEKVTQALDIIKGMSLMEAAELKKALEDEFGGTAAAPVQLANYSLLLTLVSQTYLTYFGMPSGKFYRDQNLLWKGNWTSLMVQNLRK